MPGMKPQYCPRFTDEQISAALRITKKHTASHNQVQRAQLVLLFHEQPDIENPVAARRFGRHENWVRYWRKRWCNEGFSLTDKHRSGRKPAFSPERPCVD